MSYNRMLSSLAGHPVHDGTGLAVGLRGNSAKAELAQIRRDNPVGSAGYRRPEVQKRIMEINEQLFPGKIVGTGGRTA